MKEPILFAKAIGESNKVSKKRYKSLINKINRKIKKEARNGQYEVIFPLNGYPDWFMERVKKFYVSRGYKFEVYICGLFTINWEQ